MPFLGILIPHDLLDHTKRKNTTHANLCEALLNTVYYCFLHFINLLLLSWLSKVFAYNSTMFKALVLDNKILKKISLKKSLLLKFILPLFGLYLLEWVVGTFVSEITKTIKCSCFSFHGIMTCKNIYLQIQICKFRKY